MFDWIVNLVSGSEWTYAVVLLVAGGDVLFPLLPSETLVITAAAVAAQGGLSIWLLIPATAIGAFAGDNVS
jgi:membrane-associated protein